MSLTLPPAAPTRSMAPDDFISAADAWLAWMATFVPELQAAIEVANISQWVSGTTYVIGQVVWSPVNFKSYRRKTNGAGTVDPSSDTTNWQAIPYAASGANTDISSITGNAATATAAFSAPDGSAFSHRNKIINGGMQVSQRGTGLSLSASRAYCVDRFYSYYSGLTGVSGSMNQNTGWNESTLTGRAFWTSISASTGTGKVYQGTRLEAALVRGFAGKTVTFKVKIYHDLGVTTNFTAQISKATVADNFSSTTALGTVTGNVATGTWTYLTGQVTLGATDARNGLQIEVFNTTDTAWSGGGLQTSEWQIEEGSVATPFEHRLLGVEIDLCRRYYRKSFSQSTTPAQNAGASSGAYQYPASKAGAAVNYSSRIDFSGAMRAAPTVTLYNPAAANAQVRDIDAAADCASTSAGDISDSGFTILATGNASTAIGNRLRVHWTAEAEL